ncbi:lipid A biosynthesis lauroyl acyltransferase [Roseomonas sp. CCTCC AB2023176]|uniref:lipid A biosynthesis lauroyl acyltransferase n=1 Tax=Roseomonas sp. CCTCC AB2023176 TaxID=3342640 RepID=UPI0035DC488B
MSAADPILGALTRSGFATLRALGPERGPALGASLARRLGPLTKAHRIAMENIAAAFPDRDAAWHRDVAEEAWDNLGRTACEYVHMDRIWNLTEARAPGENIQVDDATLAGFLDLRDNPRPTLVFAAHLANWELPAVAAAKHGLKAAVLYRTPNAKPVAEAILALRREMMGELIPAGIMAPTRLAKALDRGAVVGMIVDQRFGRGPTVNFLGRPAQANPLLANLGRRHDCEVRGCRAIRLGRSSRFRMELTAPLALPRDAEGLVDVPAATQAINDVIAGWIREHPGQWLWMHRRWR